MAKYTNDQRKQVLSVCSDYLEGKLSFNSAENKIRSLVPSYPVRNLKQQINSLEKCLSGKGSYGFAWPATWAKALIELFDKNPKVIEALHDQQERYYAKTKRKNMALEKLLNDHCLEDDGFVNRLKPTEVYKENDLNQIDSWPKTISPSFSSPEDEGFQPLPTGTQMNHMVTKKINYHELLRITGHQDYKSWPSLQLVHERPIDMNEEKRVFSRIDNFCRNQGKRIFGVYLYERKGEVLYIGKGKPLFNRIKSHYIESYREVSEILRIKNGIVSLVGIMAK